GIEGGIVLTTGNVADAAGPNTIKNTSTPHFSPGFPLLDNIATEETEDACVLSFDIVPQGTTIQFDYVFASEEYHEYVFSGFNDVFGFFISGPNMSNQNLAILDSGMPVSVNTVNNGFTEECASANEPLGSGVNSFLFVDNCEGENIEYDGHTIRLTAMATDLIPCETYTLTMAIADVLDAGFDSAVFIEAGSITSEPVVDFHFEHEDGSEDTIFDACEDVYLDGSATLETGSYYLDIWQVNDVGPPTQLSLQNPMPQTMSDGWREGHPTWINITDIFENDSTEPVVFQAGITYEVKLAINHPDCGWVEERRQFTLEGGYGFDYQFAHANGSMDTVFDLCEDVYLDGSTILDTGSYYMSLWKIDPITGDLAPVASQNTSPDNGWVIGSPDWVNLTEVFSTNAHPLVTFGPGTYSIQLAINHPDCGWVEEWRQFTLECCDEGFNADFGYSLSGNTGSNMATIVVDDFEEYHHVDVQHEWFVMSSPNPVGGPYDPVSITTTNDPGPLSLTFAAEAGLYYTVIHRITSECGAYCDTITLYHNGNGLKEIDDFTERTIVTDDACTLIDEVFPACGDDVALDLQITDTTLQWNPVYGVDYYTVSAPYPWERQIDCGCKTSDGLPGVVSLPPSVTSFQIPANLQNDCFILKVTAHCPRGSVSKQICYLPKGNYGSVGTVDMLISPNPNKGLMLLQVQGVSRTRAKLGIYQLDGSLLYAIENLEIATDGTAQLQWKDTKLSPGMYIVTLETDNGTVSQKVIVE
ncbi:MAG: choice-of-anchor L domain-containing protein, partial [Flavobacteriaceae bacterium]